jgi:hypothetical protein
MVLDITQNLAGVPIGNFVILVDGSVSRTKSRRLVRVQCVCGFEYDIDLRSVIRHVEQGRTKCVQCGKHRTHGHKGKIRHPLYVVWSDMKQRCYDINAKDYPRYGGSGISVCDEWKTDFQSFYDWSIANGWQRGLTLDRFPDQTGPYAPYNCRYVTRRENQANRSNTEWVTYQGRRVPLSWLCKSKTHLTAVRNRLRRGWTLEDALTREIRKITVTRGKQR